MAVPAGDWWRIRRNVRIFSRSSRTWVCDFPRCVRLHAAHRPGPLGVDAPEHERATTSISRRLSYIAARASRETLSAEREASPLPCTSTGGVTDGTAKGHNGLVVVLAFACVTNAAFAQTQATTVNGAQTSGG
jgi:hypothetical protein